MAESAVSNTVQCGFESHSGHSAAVCGTADFSYPPAPGLTHSDFVVALCDDSSMYDRGVVDRALQLKAQGLTDRTVAQLCGVSVSAVRHWRRGTRRGPRSRTRIGTPKCLCPRCHGRELDHRAYAYLLGLYLGDGYIVGTRPKEQGGHGFELACSESWPGIREAAATAITQVMPGLTVGRRHRTGCVVLRATSKHWPCLFPQHGPGMKHTRKIELADRQQKIVDEHTEEFIRGLIHSDGCRSMNRVRRPLKDGDRWYEYPRYTFTNESKDIQRLFTDALDRLGIAWRQMNRKNISVARRDAVARLDEFVGPKY
ncbi:hypothetical protein GCM10022416_21530 [Actinomadura keratinilytica]|uniref:DOD-type homing endonuclease domain-containing protein n=2 Tax=Actinomadura keratinilytica TaxID=547461 RepID=A0ABP7YJV0_9ACTN